MSAGAAAALALTPTAALAYSAPGYEVAVTSPAPAAGETFAVVASGFDEGESATLTVTSDPATIPDAAIQIAGTASLTKPVGDNGVATFAVTLTEAGVYTLVVTDENGALVGQSTVVVSADVDPAPTAPPTDPGEEPTDPDTDPTEEPTDPDVAPAPGAPAAPGAPGAPGAAPGAA
ncbi:hypothetical protein N869_02115, partial [Cellulomonas bogoriensis 69B4 = DSM 16987]